MSWNDEYTAACKEVSLAEEQYRLANSALAAADVRLARAMDVRSRLFRERMDEINSRDPTRERDGFVIGRLGDELIVGGGDFERKGLGGKRRQG